MAFCPVRWDRKTREGWSWLLAFLLGGIKFWIPPGELAFVMRNALYMVHNDYSSPFPARATREFLDLHHENLEGFLEGKAMRVWLP